MQLLLGWKKAVMVGKACYFWAKYRRTAWFLKLHIFFLFWWKENILKESTEMGHEKYSIRCSNPKIWNHLPSPIYFISVYMYSLGTACLNWHQAPQTCMIGCCDTSLECGICYYGLESLWRCWDVNSPPQSIPNPRPENRDNSLAAIGFSY